MSGSGESRYCNVSVPSFNSLLTVFAFQDPGEEEEGGRGEQEEDSGLQEEEQEDEFEDEMTAKKKIPTVEPAPRTPGKPSPKKSPVPASVEDKLANLSVREPGADGFQPYNFDIRHALITTETGYLENGTLVANFDYMVHNAHVDNFNAIVSKRGDKLKLLTKIPKVFLDLVARGRSEFDATNIQTGIYMSGIRATTNALVLDHGSDFDNIWSKGQVDILPFPCRPNPRIQVLWHDGEERLFRRLMRNPDIDANAKHQMTAILRVTVEAQDKQRMGTVRDDAVLHRRATAGSSFGDSSPPPPPGRPFAAYHHQEEGSPRGARTQQFPLWGDFNEQDDADDDFSVGIGGKSTKQQCNNKRKIPTNATKLKGKNFGDDYVHVPPYVSDSGGKEGEEDGDVHMKGVGKGGDDASL